MKKFLFLLLCTNLLLVPLFAEEAPFRSMVQPESNTFNSSGGIFETDVDKFLDVASFSEIQGDKVLFLGGTTDQLEAGFAGSLGSIYLGGYYSGSIIGKYVDLGPWNPPGKQELTTDVTTDHIYDGNMTIIGKTVTTDISQNGSFVTETSNTGAVFMGLGSMVFSLGVYQNGNLKSEAFNTPGIPLTDIGSAMDLLKSVTGNNSVDNSTIVYNSDGDILSEISEVYSDGVNNTSSIYPLLSWGAALNLGSMVMKPRVSFAFGIDGDTSDQTRSYYEMTNVEGLPVYDEMAGISAYEKDVFSYGASRYNINPEASVEFVIDKNDSLVSFGVGYKLAMYLYNNGYTDIDGTDQTVSGIASTYTTTEYTTTGILNSNETVTDAFQIDEKSEFVHSINPMVKMSKSISDRLTIGGKLRAPVTITSTSGMDSGKVQETVTYTDNLNPMNNTTTVTTLNYTGDTTAVMELDIAPEVSVGLQFDIVPDKFILNSGFTYHVPSYYSKTEDVTKSGFNTRTVEETYADGTVDTTYSSNEGAARDEKQITTQSWDDMSFDVSAGLTMNISEGYSLDLNMVYSGVNVIAIYAFTAQFVISK